MYARGDTPWVVWERTNQAAKSYQIPSNGARGSAFAPGIPSVPGSHSAAQADPNDEMELPL
jgi:hypothetical protein